MATEVLRLPSLALGPMVPETGDDSSSNASDVEMILVPRDESKPSEATGGADSANSVESVASSPATEEKDPSSPNVHHHHHYHYFYHHHFYQQQQQGSGSGSATARIPLPDAPTSSKSGAPELLINSRPLSVDGPSVPSSPITPIPQTPELLNQNTAGLVRTISNGSTFGPISWPSTSPAPPTSNNTTTPTSTDPKSNKQANVTPPTANSPATPTIAPTLPSSVKSAPVLAPPPPVAPTILATSVPVPAPHSLPASLELPLSFGEQYLLTSQIEASNLYRCVDTHTMHEYCCKVVLSRDYHDFVSGHIRMDGHEGINQVEKIIVGRVHTFILFAPSYGDLHSYVRTKRRLRESEAMALFVQIVQIVADCHAAGIILRDLKLRKFIFANKERTLLKLETLEGASLCEDDSTYSDFNDTLSDKHGCPAYVSPEILYSNSYSGMGADCWSLGVILYTMLVGRYPFHDTNPSVVFCKIRRGTYYIPESLSKHARCLIRSLIRIDPAQRLTAGDALAHRWFRGVARSQLGDGGWVKRTRSTTDGLHHHYHHHHHHHHAQNQGAANQSSAAQSASQSDTSDHPDAMPSPTTPTSVQTPPTSRYAALISNIVAQFVANTSTTSTSGDSSSSSRTTRTSGSSSEPTTTTTTTSSTTSSSSSAACCYHPMMANSHDQIVPDLSPGDASSNRNRRHPDDDDDDYMKID